MSTRRNRSGTAVEDEAQPPMDLRLLGAALAIWAGCLISLWIGVTAGYSVAAAALLVLTGCAALRTTQFLPTLAGILCCLAAGCIVTALRVQAAQHDQLTIWANDTKWVTVELVVITDPKVLLFPFSPATDPMNDSADGIVGKAANNPGPTTTVDETRYLLRASAVTVTSGGQRWTSNASLSIFAQGRGWSTLIPGDRLQVTGTLRPDSFSVLPGAALTTRSEPALIEQSYWWQQAAQQLRLRFIRGCQILEPEPAGLLPGLILGDTSGIGEKLSQDAKTSGLAHLLAVSGTHFAILCGAAMVLFRQAGPKRAALLGFFVLVSLVVLVRPGPSVLRAAVMGAVTLLAFVVGRTRTALPALAAAVIGLLLYDPTLAVNPGFALSVQATAGLVLVAPSWSEALQRRGLPAGWADLLVVPVVASLATTPVIAALSGAISLVSVPANILVAPVVAPALILGALAALLAVVWMDGAQVLIHIVGPMVSWIGQVAHLAASWPLAQLPWPSTPIGVMVLAATILILVMAMRGRRTRAVIGGLATGLLVILVPSHGLSLGWPPQNWLVVGCEVGQGDGFVLSTGIPGTAVVFDTGPDPAVMDDCLDRLQVQTIAVLVLTHLHADHIDGLTGVLDGRVVAAIGVGPGREPAAAWGQIVGAAQEWAIPVIQLRTGQTLGSGEVRLTVLGPDPRRLSSYLGPNDQSLVIRAESRGVRVLFTGDIEDAAQQALLDAGVDLSADVLKLPHHGSAKLLPAFVEAVGAPVVLIGVGKDNDFGHPTQSALELVSGAGARAILRTDVDGEIAICLTDLGLTTVSRGARTGPAP